MQTESNKKFILTRQTESWHVIDDVICKYYIHDIKKPIMVTFASLNSFLDQTEIENGISPWGYDFVKKQGLNIISFSSINKNTWYRSNILYHFMMQLSSELEVFPERLGYGGSMGGYGVSSYCNILKLDRILIINPISTLNKSLVPWEYRFTHDRENLDWESGEVFDGAQALASGYIIYDPLFDLDKKHAQRYQNLIHLKVPGVGHSMPKHLQEMNMLKKTLISFIHNRLDPFDFHSDARKRRTIPRYYKWLLSKENKHLTKKRKYIIYIHRTKYYIFTHSKVLLKRLLS
ncbi:hypothetical protein ACM66Z_02365 [Sulfurovum sp. ST-21]|uniref:Alpha/beta hydrolase n=1 Tax=Sulfurovum indicum TaxID=2779528 RepID=A0A7M1S4J9_9BACT|nr:hypothetical protein [Sulfurovum indicum]QOR62337.1 hypothetical protein IMZ28_02355 [Sulfurovum indicum]